MLPKKMVLDEVAVPKDFGELMDLVNTTYSALAQEKWIPRGVELRHFCRGVFGFVLVG
jgi:hypothetical protein